jgi:alpha-galactosidase
MKTETAGNSGTPEGVSPHIHTPVLKGYKGSQVFQFLIPLGFMLAAVLPLQGPCWGQQPALLQNEALAVTVRPSDGSYEIRAAQSTQPALAASIGAEIDHQWLRSNRYPHHKATASTFQDALGKGRQISVAFSGLASQPDLSYVIRVYDGMPFGSILVSVRNGTGKEVTVQAIRSLEALGEAKLELAGPAAADRILADSFSEDRPEVEIHDLAQATEGLRQAAASVPGGETNEPLLRGIFRGVGSELIYNRQSRQSLFLGALTSERFLTLLHLQVTGTSEQPVIASYTVDSSGTTEVEKEQSLRRATPENQIELSLPLGPGQAIDSEALMFAVGPNYHTQLEAYGRAIRVLHQGRVSARNPMGWWSWTAFYGGINHGEVSTNAYWLARHLKSLGYDYCHIDEGYDYARGEYAIANAVQFPNGMRAVGEEVGHLGLKLGVWTAPFEVSRRAWVYEHHKDWLVHNAQGEPIPIGQASSDRAERLYVLDTTNPGAQGYLRQTYRTLARDWGVRYIKLDFMDDSAIEGFYRRPHTTALEAQRIGLKIIRQAVGDGVLLDKDGSPMLNPVGIVDTGRLSIDTGHSFIASKVAGPGIAARYYMNRTFFISDPDAFSISAQVIPQQRWHQSRQPLTLHEAEVAITLAAVSGGMYEIGDDLPTVGADPARLALLKNPDLLAMIKLERAAVPMDLMTYSPEDGQPSVFLLKEDRRQSLLAVFNWTEGTRSHSFTLEDLGLPRQDSYEAADALNREEPVSLSGGQLQIQDQLAHSVRLIKIIDTSVAAAAPSVRLEAPETVKAGDAAKLEAVADAGGVPVLSYHWDFGDGTEGEGAQATHTFTRAAVYTVKLTAQGVDGIAEEKTVSIEATGYPRSRFDFPNNRRYQPPEE